MQLKPIFTRTLRKNLCLAQEPLSTSNTPTKHVVKKLGTRNDKADLLQDINSNSPHLSHQQQQEKLLSMAALKVHAWWREPTAHLP
jgi:hypothetical protein